MCQKLLSAIIAVAMLTSCKEQLEDSFRSRDGAAEAMADWKAARPIRLYSRPFWGVAPGWDTPGLAYCAPDDASDHKAFQGLSGAAFYEGTRRTAEQNRIAGSAVRFAEDYNRTIYHLRRGELTKLCPDVQLDPGTARIFRSSGELSS